MTEPHATLDIPVARAGGDLAGRFHPAVRGGGAGIARARGAPRARGRHHPAPSTTYPTPVAKLLGEAIVLDGHAGLGAQVRGPLHPADADRRAGAHAGRRLPSRLATCARLPASTRSASRPRSTRGRPTAGALLGKGHLAMTVDQGVDTAPLSGPHCARGQGPPARRPRIFPALGADPDPRAARGRRGAEPRRCRHRASLARRRDPAAVRAEITRPRAAARSRSGRCAGRLHAGN